MKQLWKDKHGILYAGPGPQDAAQAYEWAMLDLKGTMGLSRAIPAASFNEKMETCLERLDVIKKIVVQENQGLHSELTALHQELTDAD